MTIASAFSISATGIANGFGDGAVGQVALRDAMVEVAGAQRVGQAREQRALLVRRRRMHEHAELVGAVVAQDLRGARQRFFPRRFAPLAAVLAPSAAVARSSAYRPWCE